MPKIGSVLTSDMDNKRIDEGVAEFWASRTRVSDPLVATHFRADNSHHFDFEFLKTFVDPHSEVLDLGAGSCIVALQLAETVKEIVAVDRFCEFLEMAGEHPKLKKVVSDVRNYTTDQRFDLITVFGLLNYFETDDLMLLVQKIKRFLKPEGSLVIKHQCGIFDEVRVDYYSKEINSIYYAIYRWIETELRFLREIFSDVTVYDIYPAELNKWTNTHFYAFVCRL